MQRELDQFMKEASADPGVAGVMLFGSQARGLADEFSDIDVYVLRSKRGPWARLNRVSRKLRLDIFFDTQDQLGNYLRGERHSVRRPTSHMLAHGNVLFQRGTALARAKALAIRNLSTPTRYTSEELLMHKYSIDDFWGEVQRDYRSGDAVSFGMSCQLLISNVTELFLKLRGGFFVPPREMRALLRRLDRRFASLVEGYYSAGTPKAKVAILKRVVAYSFVQAGGPMPKRWGLRS